MTQISHLTKSPVTIYPYSTTGTDGTVTWGTGVSYFARLSNKKTYIKTPTGQVIVSNGRLYISGDVSNLDDRDKILLPGSNTVYIKDFAKMYDRYANVLYTVVYF